MDQEIFPLDRLEDIQKHPQDFRLVERVPLTRMDILERLPIHLYETVPGEKTSSIIFLDTETTGLNHSTDKIIELAMVKCTISLDRNIILSVDRIFDQYEDPHMAIPPEVVELTGIDNAKVANQYFNQEEVASFVVDQPLIVAHNAAFDRPFFELRFSHLTQLPWACSYKEVPWFSLGYKTANLGALLEKHHYFFDGHKAYIDCLALCFLMFKDPTAFKYLLESSLSDSYYIEAYGAPFECKDRLKEHKYSFVRDKKVWAISVNGAQAAIDEENFLISLYPEARNKAVFTRFTAYDKYRK